MPNTTRRTLLTGAASTVLFTPSIVSANALGGGPLGQGTSPLEHGLVTISDFGEVKIHSYQSPDLTGCVTTHIVETPERLVFIDGQRSVIYGQEVRDYAEKTGKPVDRMIVSHLHPDHWFGADRFRDVPIYSFEVIDGVTFEYRYVQDAESDNMMTIYLPDQKVLIAQDMLYNNCHLFCGHGNFDGWADGLKSMQADTSFDLVLPGHGATQGSRQAIDDALIYLDHAKASYARAETPEQLKTTILERYPSYMAAGLVDIQNLFLFPDGQKPT